MAAAAAGSANLKANDLVGVSFWVISRRNALNRSGRPR
jgi:hypothetical protein